MHRFEEDPVVPALGAPPGAAGPEYLHAVAQSSSVIRVSMVGSSQTDLPSVADPRTWESTHCILSPIRPHGLALQAFQTCQPSPALPLNPCRIPPNQNRRVQAPQAYPHNPPWSGSGAKRRPGAPRGRNPRPWEFPNRQPDRVPPSPATNQAVPATPKPFAWLIPPVGN